MEASTAGLRVRSGAAVGGLVWTELVALRQPPGVRLPARPDSAIRQLICRRLDRPAVQSRTRPCCCYCPLAIAAVPAWLAFRRRQAPTAWLFLAIFVTLFAVYASLGNWMGGRWYGPRYLVLALPALTLPFAFWAFGSSRPLARPSVGTHQHPRSSCRAFSWTTPKYVSSVRARARPSRRTIAGQLVRSF